MVISSVLINLHRPISQGFIVKRVQIVKKASGWYAIICIQSDVKIPSPKPQGKYLGIDLGVSKFIATSQGELIARPKFFISLQSKLKWLQRRLSKKQKGSKNRLKAIQKVARLHEHIDNSRKNFHDQIAHHLCDQAQGIFGEEKFFLPLNLIGNYRKNYLDYNILIVRKLLVLLIGAGHRPR